jgi:hypothetical protein
MDFDSILGQPDHRLLLCSPLKPIAIYAGFDFMENTGADEAMPALIEPVLTSRAFRKNWASLVSIS